MLMTAVEYDLKALHVGILQKIRRPCAIFIDKSNIPLSLSWEMIPGTFWLWHSQEPYKSQILNHVVG